MEKQSKSRTKHKLQKKKLSMHPGRPPCSRRLEQCNWGPDPALTIIHFMKKESWCLSLNPNWELFFNSPSIPASTCHHHHPHPSSWQCHQVFIISSAPVWARLVAPTPYTSTICESCSVTDTWHSFTFHARWASTCRVKWHLTPQKYFLCQFSFPLSCIFQHLALRR